MPAMPPGQVSGYLARVGDYSTTTSWMVEGAWVAGWLVTGSTAESGVGTIACGVGEAPVPEQLLADSWEGSCTRRPDIAGPCRPRRAKTSTHVVQISTTYATRLRGATQPSDLTDHCTLSNPAEAEREAVRWCGATVVCPPLAVRRCSDGRVRWYTGLYAVTQSGVTGLLRVFIGEVDTLAEVVCTCHPIACVL